MTKAHSCFLGVRIHWAGWETDTVRLQQAGWSLSAQQDLSRFGMRIAMKHPEWNVYGLTEIADFDYMRSARDYDFLGGFFLRAQVASRFYIERHEMGETVPFKPIDAQPMFLNRRRESLDDFAHFAVPLARTQEIVVPEPDVADLLDKILKIQEPSKNEYFKRLVREEGEQFNPQPRQKFHAQIVSIAA